MKSPFKGMSGLVAALAAPGEGGKHCIWRWCGRQGPPDNVGCPGDPLHAQRRIGVLLVMCCTILASVAQEQSGAGQVFEPICFCRLHGSAIPAPGAFPDVMVRYDPSMPEMAVWEASVFHCGAEQAPQRHGVTAQGTIVDSTEATLGWRGAETPITRSVDVMVLYTPEARLLCGQTKLESTILLGIACANETFRRSQLMVELRLVHLGEASGYEESGKLSAAMAWLLADASVESLRSEYGADLVSLVVSRGDYSGIASCGGSHCVLIANPVTFTHEIGHNFGCGHERARPATCWRHPFSFAYVFTPPAGGGHTYGTIMSCVGSTILNFSNPNVYFLGRPTGLPKAHCDDLGHADSADNARTVAVTAAEVAAREPTRVSSLECPILDEAGNTFSFDIAGGAREDLVVEYTSDFVHWMPLGNYRSGSGSVKVIDVVHSVRARFYRAGGGSKGPVRVIGFYRRSVPAGYSLIANQLDHGGNRVERLFTDLPLGTKLYKWDAFAQRFIENSLEPSGWTRPEMELRPGEGAVLQTERPLTLAFVGHVRRACYVPMNQEWSLVSSPLPLSGGIASALDFPLGSGGQTTEIVTYAGGPPSRREWTFEDGSWVPLPEPQVQIGEAFWCHSSPNRFVWKRILLPFGQAVAPAGELTLKVAHSQAFSIHLTIQGDPAAACQIEGSTDLIHWTVLATVTNRVGQSSWTDPAADSHRRRFYRARRIGP